MQNRVNSPHITEIEYDASKQTWVGIATRNNTSYPSRWSRKMAAWSCNGTWFTHYTEADDELDHAEADCSCGAVVANGNSLCTDCDYMACSFGEDGLQ